MPGRRKDLRPKVGENGKGPGQYDPFHNSIKKNGPLFSVGKMRRDGEIGIFKNTPGAGTYADEAVRVNRAKSASWRIGSEKRPEKQHYVPPTPGPGSYNLTQTDMGKNGPKYSANKRPVNPVKDSPGPGAYQPVVQNVQNKAAQYKLGTRKRTMLEVLNKNPGPGAHIHQSQLSGSKYGFGTSGRQKLNADSTPGPGSYEY